MYDRLLIWGLFFPNNTLSVRCNWFVVTTISLLSRAKALKIKMQFQKEGLYGLESASFRRVTGLVSNSKSRVILGYGDAFQYFWRLSRCKYVRISNEQPNAWPNLEVLDDFTWAELRITKMYVKAMCNGRRKPISHVRHPALELTPRMHEHQAWTRPKE